MPATPFLDRLAASWPLERWIDRAVIVAVSGGADSVALLAALVALRRQEAGKGRIVAAHFNHQLRGAESDGDAEFVRSLAKKLGVEVVVGQAAADLAAEKRRRGLEGSARDARYDFLRQAARSEGARYVAVAHTADDQAETILHHILRGTGLAGLRGMPRARPLAEGVSLIRPLLSIARSELRDYLAAIGQDFRTDSSNADLDRTRNRIRHELLPSLARDFNPEIHSALIRLARLGGEAYEVVENLAAELAARAVIERSDQQVTLRRKAFGGAAPIVVREALIVVWREQDWSRDAMGLAEWELLAEMVKGEGSETARTFPGNIEARCDGETIVLRERTGRGS